MKRLKIILCLIFALFFISATAEATNTIYFSKTALTGGGATALDYLDGDLLTDGDIAFVMVSNVLYVYKMDADSAAAESSPDIISPDTNAGDKRWLLQNYYPQLGTDLKLNGYQITSHRDDHWTKVATASFTATPASTSTITMGVDMTSSILAGMSLKYTIGGTTYYGRVSAIAAGLLTVNGAPLGGDVTALYYGGGTTRQVQLIIPGAYEDASNTALITSDLKSNFIWSLPKSYLVYFSVYSDTHDTGTHGQASVRINNTEVNTSAGGETIAADKTWYPTVVNIDTAAYDVNPGEAIEVTAVKNGNGNAAELTVKMIFVTP